ncbi:MAG: AbrB/MazE/SpoVT family DNA-binding domain-containing protein [Xenococcaceae cyanobacterium MO_207.B15]|nr:AbrB/MazE/SpoVT family DNA-binding domain-containing protein [Xenococcaceae cyanobacterium MO_207.B15]
MEAKITKIGNSQGIIIPKAIIEQCNLTDRVNLEVKNNNLIISAIVENPRQGWEEAIIAAGVDENEELLMGDYLEHSWDEEEWTW